MPGASQPDFARTASRLAYILLDPKTRTDVWTAPLDDRAAAADPPVAGVRFRPADFARRSAASPMPRAKLGQPAGLRRRLSACRGGDGRCRRNPARKPSGIRAAASCSISTAAAAAVGGGRRAGPAGKAQRGVRRIGVARAPDARLRRRARRRVSSSSSATSIAARPGRASPWWRTGLRSFRRAI